ncbi:MAG TPA: integrase arm-type DNA-binding domain-containing protein [Pseudomonas sp.]|jgi:integrase|uniref:tyrosine-type recombinase/integrase n=1 Tax=Pseudomonas sp. TaxID=306 RepID=UPI002EDB69E8
MARTVTPLTDTKCDAAKAKEKDSTLFDGQGLFLLVKKSGVKVWRFKYKRPDGRPGLATFGNYPALSLKAARSKRSAALENLAAGIDPMTHAKETKLQAAAERLQTFELMAREWHAANARKWSPGHANTVMRRLENHLFPDLGKRPVAELKARDLIPPLKAAEARESLDLASRLRNYQEGILRYAVQHGFIDSNPARDLVGITAPAQTVHRPALPLNRLPELLQKIEGDTGRPLTRLALKMTLLVFIRSSELRFARWGEIDQRKAMWEIPGQRAAIEGVKHSVRGSKMGTAHMVPLSRQALEVVDQLKALTGKHVLVFTGDHKSWMAMSDATINKALRRMGYDTKVDVCGHGFRTMACSALVESGLWSRDVVERQMSHKEQNSVRAAYVHRAEMLDERRLMLQWWADYIDANRESYVSPFDFAHRGEDAANVVPIKRA